MDGMVVDRRKFLVLPVGVISGFLVSGLPVSICLVLFALILAYILLHNNPYTFSDIPFLILIIGTFAFGRAFSALGMDFGVVPVFVTEFVLLCIFGFVLFYGKVENFGLWLPRNINISLFIYVLLGSIYLVFGLINNGLLAIRDIPFCIYTLFLFITIMVFKSEERLKKLLWLVVPSGIVALFVGFGIVFNLIPKDSSIGMFLLETRTFNLNLYYCLMFAFGLSFFYYVRKGRLLLGFLVILSLLLNMLLQVRTGWFASIACLGFLGILLRKEFMVILRRYGLIIILGFIVFLVLLAVVFPQIILGIKEELYGLFHWQRDTVPGGNVVWRFDIWRQAISKIAKHPFLGWGFGAQPDFLWFGKQGPKIIGIGPGSRIVPTHNYLLAITFKMGLTGLAVFLFINFKIFFYGLGYFRKCKSEFNRRFLIASLAGVVCWHSMALFFDIIESPPTSIFLWILLGLILCVVYSDKKD